MKNLTFLVVFFVLVGVTALAQTTSKQLTKMSKTEQEFNTLAREFATAIVKRDTAAMEQLLAEDYLDVSNSGEVTSKSELIAFYKARVPANAGTLDAIDVADLKIRIYGDTVIGTARTAWRGKRPDGQAASTTFLATVVAGKKNGRWQIVHTHQSKTP